MGFTHFMMWVFGDTLVEDVVLSTLRIMAKIKHIRNVGNIYTKRSEQFQFKQVVSDFIEELVAQSAKNAEQHISQMNYATFCYGELQMHSIIVPAIANLAGSVILEYPIIRGKDNDNGRVDYYCVNKVGTKSEYHLFLELKCGRQGIPNNKLRTNNIELWRKANKQLDGISQEIKKNKNFYNKPTIRVCMEVIVLYTDKSKGDKIRPDTLQEALNIAIEDLKQKNTAPNISMLWEFHPNIVKQAKDEYRPNRQFWGILFLCRVMPDLER